METRRNIYVDYVSLFQDMNFSIKIFKVFGPKAPSLGPVFKYNFTGKLLFFGFLQKKCFFFDTMLRNKH